MIGTAVCSVEGCDALARRRGMCGTHVRRLERNGDPLVTRRFVGSVEERLLHHSALSENGCLNWTGSKSRGYGKIRVNGRTVPAQRAAYETWVGPIPEGYEVDHLCCNPSCINPDHLEAVTPRENKIRANGWAGTNYRKTHCVHGHEYTPENTRLDHRGNRTCRACHRAYQAAWVRRRRAGRKT